MGLNDRHRGIPRTLTPTWEASDRSNHRRCRIRHRRPTNNPQRPATTPRLPHHAAQLLKRPPGNPARQRRRSSHRQHTHPTKKAQGSNQARNTSPHHSTPPSPQTHEPLTRASLQKQIARGSRDLKSLRPLDPNLNPTLLLPITTNNPTLAPLFRDQHSTQSTSIHPTTFAPLHLTARPSGAASLHTQGT